MSNATQASKRAATNDVLGDLIDEALVSMGTTCPECRNPMGKDGSVCVKCGFNLETGKRMGTKVVAFRKPKGEKKQK